MNIASGYSRIVLLVGRYAIKLPRTGSYGWLGRSLVAVDLSRGCIVMRA